MIGTSDRKMLATERVEGQRIADTEIVAVFSKQGAIGHHRGYAADIPVVVDGWLGSERAQRSTGGAK